MSKFGKYNHSTLERITSSVLNRISEKALEMGQNLGEGYTTDNHSVLKNGVFSAGTGLQVIFDQNSILSFRNTITDFIQVKNEEELYVTLSTADATNPRIDVIKAKVEIAEEKNKSVDVINDLTKVITPQTKNTEKNYKITLEVDEGTPAPSPAAPGITGGITVASFVSDGNYDDSVERDLSSAQNLITNYNIKIRIDSGSWVTIDLRGADPGATSLTEIVANINSALDTAYGTSGTVYAEINNSKYLQLNAIQTDETGKIEISNPASADATSLILGLTEEPSGYFYSIKSNINYMKLAEITVPAGATSLSAGNILGVLEKEQWDDPGDYAPVVGLNNVFSDGIYTDQINEMTSGNGVTIDGAKIKDNDGYFDEIRSANGSNPTSFPTGVYSDQIDEVTPGNGVILDGTRLKDGQGHINSFRKYSSTELPDYKSIPSGTEYYTGEIINGQKVYALRFNDQMPSSNSGASAFFSSGYYWTKEIVLDSILGVSSRVYPVRFDGVCQASNTTWLSPGGVSRLKLFGFEYYFSVSFSNYIVAYAHDTGTPTSFNSRNFYVVFYYTKSQY